MAGCSKDEYEFFDGISAILLPDGLAPARLNVFCDKLKEKGGHVTQDECNRFTSHVFALSWSTVEDHYACYPWRWRLMQETMSILHYDYLTACLIHGELVEEDEFKLRRMASEEQSLPPKMEKKRKQPLILVPNPKTMEKLMEKCRAYVPPKFHDGPVNRISE